MIENQKTIFCEPLKLETSSFKGIDTLGSYKTIAS
jgi:hypothetical protein